MAYTKSIDHISKYPPVSALASYLLSFQLINYFYQHLTALATGIDKKAVPKFVSQNLNNLDETFDKLVLGNIDTYIVPYLPTVKSLSDLNPISIFSAYILAPINTTVYNTADKFLPATATDNKVVFNLSELGETSEFNKSIAIGKELYSRVVKLLTTKADEISSHVSTTYNKELNTLSNAASEAESEVNNVRKHVSASYQTSVKVASDLNKNYIQPLKEQTENYVADVANSTKSKADSLISDTKASISQSKNKADTLISDAKTGLASGVNSAVKNGEEAVQKINGTSIQVN